MAKDQSKSKNKPKDKKPVEEPDSDQAHEKMDKITESKADLEMVPPNPVGYPPGMFPTKEDPIPEPGPTPELEPELVEVVTAVGTRVAMRVYLAACSYRWDQMMGFKSYATTRKMGPLTMREWNEAYKDYLNRPVE